MAAAQPCNEETVQHLWSSSSLRSFAISTSLVGCTTPFAQGAVPPLCKAEMAAAALCTEYSAIPVQSSPAAATLLRLTGAPLSTTRLLRLVTALSAGWNSTSLMGSSPESCGTRQSRSDALQYTESQQVPSLLHAHVLKCLHTLWHARWTGNIQATNWQQSKSLEPKCSLMGFVSAWHVVPSWESS